VDERVAVRRGLPQAGRVPVELLAQARQQLTEGVLGVVGPGERLGHPEDRGQVAADLELALEQDGRAGVPQHPHDHATVGAVGVQRREGEVDRDLVARPVQGADLGGGADELTLAGVEEAGEPGRVRSAEALRHQDRERLPDQRLDLVAQQGGDRRVGVDDPALRVGHDNGVREDLQRRGGVEGTEHLIPLPRPRTGRRGTTPSQIGHSA
jgi:hypothetical protein